MIAVARADREVVVSDELSSDEVDLIRRVAVLEDALTKAERAINESISGLSQRDIPAWLALLRELQAVLAGANNGKGQEQAADPCRPDDPPPASTGRSSPTCSYCSGSMRRETGGRWLCTDPDCPRAWAEEL
jgi:hypothetical protein